MSISSEFTMGGERFPSVKPGWWRGHLSLSVAGKGELSFGGDQNGSRMKAVQTGVRFYARRGAHSMDAGCDERNAANEEP
jgi:hypothetical protein